MLVLTRKAGQAISIEPQVGMDLDTPIRTLFEKGPIEIVVLQVSGNHVRVGISADARLTVLRNELRKP